MMRNSRIANAASFSVCRLPDGTVDAIGNNDGAIKGAQSLLSIKSWKSGQVWECPRGRR